MKYKLKDFVTGEMLHDEFFNRKGERGVGMGWEHYVNWNTREIRFADDEYAKKYDVIGGLKEFIKDLIELGYVEALK